MICVKLEQALHILANHVFTNLLSKVKLPLKHMLYNFKEVWKVQTFQKALCEGTNFHFRKSDVKYQL